MLKKVFCVLLVFICWFSVTICPADEVDPKQRLSDYLIGQWSFDETDDLLFTDLFGQLS